MQINAQQKGRRQKHCQRQATKQILKSVVFATSLAEIRSYGIVVQCVSLGIMQHAVEQTVVRPTFVIIVNEIIEI